VTTPVWSRQSSGNNSINSATNGKVPVTTLNADARSKGPPSHSRSNSNSGTKEGAIVFKSNSLSDVHPGHAQFAIKAANLDVSGSFFGSGMGSVHSSHDDMNLVSPSDVMMHSNISPTAGNGLDGSREQGLMGLLGIQGGLQTDAVYSSLSSDANESQSFMNLTL
jgi:hypothetical protein